MPQYFAFADLDARAPGCKKSWAAGSAVPVVKSGIPLLMGEDEDELDYDLAKVCLVQDGNELFVIPECELVLIEPGCRYFLLEGGDLFYPSRPTEFSTVNAVEAVTGEIITLRKEDLAHLEGGLYIVVLKDGVWSALPAPTSSA